jgi:hypothetical protein
MFALSGSLHKPRGLRRAGMPSASGTRLLVPFFFLRYRSKELWALQLRLRAFILADWFGLWRGWFRAYFPEESMKHSCYLDYFRE